MAYTHTEDHRIVRQYDTSNQRADVVGYRATFTNHVGGRVEKFFKLRREAVAWLKRMDAEINR